MVRKKKYVSIHDFLRDQRVDVGLSQVQLASKLGLSSGQYISNWERGMSMPPVYGGKQILKLTSILKIDVNDYIDRILEEQRRKILKEIKKR